MINFKKGKVYKKVNFTGVTIGSELELELKSFSYYKGLVFGYFKDEDSSIRAILGNVENLDYQLLLAKKGTTMTVRYNGMNGEYPKLSVTF